MIVDFPLCALPPNSVSLAQDFNTRPGHETTNGMRRSLGMSGAQFRLSLGGIVLNSVQRIRAMRGYLANMEADSALVRIRLPDIYGLDGPWSIATKASRKANPLGVPFATDALYGTGVGHAVPTLETTAIEAAAVNSREIIVDLPDDTIGGCAVSIDEFCYMIAGSWVEGGVNRLRLSPVLRKPIAAGAVIALAPVFVGFCVTDKPGYEPMRRAKDGTVSLEFVEDLTRLVEDID
jgi:hypothetical protein